LSDSPKAWKPGREPWCWQSKAILRQIREALDAENAVSSGLLVYVALTEIASDKQSPTFQTTHSFIAMRCGLSQRTVQQRIRDLTEIGVLKCAVSNLRAPATYELLAVPVTQPLPDVVQPLHSVTQPLPDVVQPLHSVTQRSKKAPLRTLEESLEEKPNNTERTCSTKARKLSASEKTLADMAEKILGNEWANDAGKWLNRITGGLGDDGKRIAPTPDKVRRVFADTARAVKDFSINTTPARYAENTWKEFK
jgi:DNA-binding Lrp family transcriptional regulator